MNTARYSIIAPEHGMMEMAISDSDASEFGNESLHDSELDEVLHDSEEEKWNRSNH